MNNKIFLTESEKNRILGMHKNAIINENKNLVIEADLKQIQQLLIDKGFMGKTKPDGKNADDGIAGPMTLDALYNALSQTGGASGSSGVPGTQGPSGVAGTQGPSGVAGSENTADFESKLKVELDKITDPASRAYFEKVLRNENGEYLQAGYVPQYNQSGKLSTGEAGIPDGYKVDVKWYITPKDQIGKPNQIWFTDNGQSFKINVNPSNPQQLVGRPMNTEEGQTPDKADMTNFIKLYGQPPTALNWVPEGKGQNTTTNQGTSSTTAATTTNQVKLLDRVPTNKEIRQGLRRRKKYNNRMDRQKRKQLDDLYNQYEKIAGSIQKFGSRDDGSEQFKQQMATLENQMKNINAQIDKLETT